MESVRFLSCQITVKYEVQLRLLRLVIGQKISRHFFNQRERKPKPIAFFSAPCARFRRNC